MESEWILPLVGLTELKDTPTCTCDLQPLDKKKKKGATGKRMGEAGGRGAGDDERMKRRMKWERKEEKGEGETRGIVGKRDEEGMKLNEKRGMNRWKKFYN
ncbi:unnamed protein product [Pleuronectes platessa]|uniref:Uncharacterized protein n=1 Tax=Pleuronectes platessa TaxID=8262 RepID=A0A9N7TKY8_PLEPL|nr:unnamed protein product [Pleuronectes platessa]